MCGGSGGDKAGALLSRATEVLGHVQRWETMPAAVSCGGGGRWVVEVMSVVGAVCNDRGEGWGQPLKYDILKIKIKN